MDREGSGGEEGGGGTPVQQDRFAPTVSVCFMSAREKRRTARLDTTAEKSRA